MRVMEGRNIVIQEEELDPNMQITVYED